MSNYVFVPCQTQLESQQHYLLNYLKWIGRTKLEHPNYGIIKIGQNTVKSPGDLRRLAVAQTPVRNHQIALIWKILKRVYWPYEKMVCTQPRICSGEWDAQIPLGLSDTNGSPNLGQITAPYNNLQQKITCRIVNFTVPADHRVNLEESEKKDKYLDLVGNWKNCDGDTNYNWCSWYSHQRIGKMRRGLRNKCRDNPNYIQHCWDQLEYWEESWRLEETCCHSDPSERPSANADVKNSQGVKMIIHFWPYEQMVYAQTRIRVGEWDAQNSQGFWDANRSLYPSQKTKTSDN